MPLIRPIAEPAPTPAPVGLVDRISAWNADPVEQPARALLRSWTCHLAARDLVAQTRATGPQANIWSSTLRTVLARRNQHIVRFFSSWSPMADNESVRRALYHMTYDGRGPYTNLVAAHLADCARLQTTRDVLFQLSLLQPPGTPTTALDVTLALVTNERNVMLDKFFREWTPEKVKEALDQETQ